MADVNVNMDAGRVSVKSDPTPVEKPRKLDLASSDTWARLRALEKRKQAAAEKRGPWKDATAKQRAEAKAIVAEIAEIKAQLVAEHRAAKDAEREKQAAAAKRERVRKGDD